MNRVITLAGTSVIAFAIIYYFVSLSNNAGVSGAFGVESGSIAAQLLIAFIAFITTLIGVMLGSLYRRLVALRDSGQRNVQFRILIKRVFASIDFKIGLVGAPIVFGLLWQAISDVSLPGMLIIALQNGFASHAVLKEVSPFQGDQQT